MGMQQPRPRQPPHGHAAKAKACSSQGLGSPPWASMQPRPRQPHGHAAAKGLGSPPMGTQPKAKGVQQPRPRQPPSEGQGMQQPRPRQPPMGMQQPRPRQPPKCMQQPRQPPHGHTAKAKLSSSQGLGKDGHWGVVVSLRRERGKEIIFFLGGIFFWGKEWMRRGRDESKRHRAESQWIVAARPLCHLQYPVAYLSRLQRILPAARWELYFMAAHAARPPRGLGQRHVPLGARGPLLRVGNRAAGARVASSPDSDLEAFSHNPAHGSFAPLAFQPSAMTNCANQRFLSY